MAPPQAMIDGLRAHPELFRRVTPVTGTFAGAEDTGPQQPYRTRPDGSYTQDEAAVPTGAEQLTRMRSIASSLGMDYLLVFGGQIEHGQQGSGLELFDLTIVGAFVIPSHGITVDGKAVGSLIDVHTGQIVMSYSAQVKGSGAAPSAFAANVEETSVLKNRDELIGKLTADVVSQMSDEAKANAHK